MEIVKNRYGSDRVIEKISPTKLRIMGESEFSRGAVDADGNQTMFDFEGGFMFECWRKNPIYENKLDNYKNQNRRIQTQKDASVIVEVKL